MLAPVVQTATPYRRHGLEQRLARWPLMAHDRAYGSDPPLTQDFIAMMLGVHRPSITATPGILQRAGLIRYANGHVTVLDVASLEAASLREADQLARPTWAFSAGPAAWA